MFSDMQRSPTAPCCCRLVVMSATLGGGVGPKVARLLAQALPQRYEAVRVTEAGVSPAQEDAGGRTATPAEHVVTSVQAVGGVAAPFLVSQGRSFRVRTEYVGLPGAAAGDWCWLHNCKGSIVLDIPWGCPCEAAGGVMWCPQFVRRAASGKMSCGQHVMLCKGTCVAIEVSVHFVYLLNAEGQRIEQRLRQRQQSR